MEKSKVFFTDLRTVPGNDLLTKLERLIRKAGIADIDFEGKFTAIKIHFGEPGNMAYIRPNYALLAFYGVFTHHQHRFLLPHFREGTFHLYG